MTARVEGDALRDLASSDDGIGIASSSRAQIFEMFSQGRDARWTAPKAGSASASRSSKDSSSCTAARVEACSEGPGSGSEFVVALPCRQGAAPVPAPPLRRASPATIGAPNPRRRRQRRRGGRPRDAPAARGPRGAHARTAAKPRWTLASAFQPEIALLDIGMPDLNGYDVARQLRGSARGKDLRLIALTGWGQEDDKRRARDAGFDHHLTKPVDPRRLDALLLNGAA